MLTTVLPKYITVLNCHHDEEAHQSTIAIANQNEFFLTTTFTCVYFLFVHQPSQDQRKFLLPWIMIMVLHVLLELAHFIYLLAKDTVSEVFFAFLLSGSCL